LSDLPDYAVVNRETWTKANAEYTDANAEKSWSREITWGVWSVPEDEIHALPDVGGKDVIELGCGTAYFSAYLARLGARVVGVDVTPAQLETARRMQKKFGLEFPLIEANAEDVPLPDASFDVVHSEYGASIWCDPYKWIPEAARLLRPGGHLVFLRNSTLAVLCATVEGPPSETLQRPQLGLHKLEWSEPDPEIEFHLGHGDLIGLLRANAFEIEALIELFAPTGAPRATMLVDGYFFDGWLAKRGAVTLWPDAGGRTAGSLHLSLSMPPDTAVMKVELTATGYARTVTVRPGKSTDVTVRVSTKGPWTLRYYAPDGGVASDDRRVSVLSTPPVFTRTGGTVVTCAPPVGKLS